MCTPLVKVIAALQSLFWPMLSSSRCKPQSQCKHVSPAEWKEMHISYFPKELSGFPRDLPPCTQEVINKVSQLLFFVKYSHKTFWFWCSLHSVLRLNCISLENHLCFTVEIEFSPKSMSPTLPPSPDVRMAAWTAHSHSVPWKMIKIGYLDTDSSWHIVPLSKPHFAVKIC